MPANWKILLPFLVALVGFAAALVVAHGQIGEHLHRPIEARQNLVHPRHRAVHSIEPATDLPLDCTRTSRTCLAQAARHTQTDQTTQATQAAQTTHRPAAIPARLHTPETSA